MAEQRWLASGKRRDNRDIRDFVVLHGKILKGGAEEEQESDFQSPPSGAATGRGKQTRITVYRESGGKAAGRGGRLVAPASKFSKGVRKKVGPVELVDDDKENRRSCARPPCTAPALRERGSRRRNVQRREIVNHPLKHPGKSSEIKTKQSTSDGPPLACVPSPSTRGPSCKGRTASHTHTTTTHLPHPHSNCEGQDFNGETWRGAVATCTSKRESCGVIAKPTGSRADSARQDPVQGTEGSEFWISCRKRKHRSDAVDDSPRLAALSSKHSAVSEELCPVSKKLSEGPPGSEQKEGTDPPGSGQGADQDCSSREVDSDDIIVESYDTNALLAELSYYEKL